MKLLKDILYKARLEEVIGSTNVAVDRIEFDSRKVSAFTAFVAVRGTQTDGHQFIEKAIESGAAAVICEEIPEKPKDGITYVKVRNSAQALGYMASNYYGNPSEKIKLTGVTGTNGKTSVVTMSHALFSALGHKSGLISTVVNKIGKEEISATHTTPDALSINKLMAQMADEGCSHCFMEVSSHAIAQHRITGLQFDVAVFTNITHEHLDYHKTFDNYIAAKKKLFDDLSARAVAIYNRDDRRGEIMVQNTSAATKSFALKTLADYKAKVIENQFTGLQLNINGKDVWTKLVGKFNAYNLLSVYAIADAFGAEELTVLTVISSLNPVAGRFQHIKTEKGVNGIVDYAHTPDALENVLKTINDVRTGNETVICVVGCGGDRDTTKRPVMAKIAAKLADRVILTSDNPRTENPDTIIEDMKKGLDPSKIKKTLAVTQRGEAIRTAAALANPGDIILIAGKGHETYQEVNGVRNHFDDMEELNNALQNS